MARVPANTCGGKNIGQSFPFTACHGKAKVASAFYVESPYETILPSLPITKI